MIPQYVSDQLSEALACAERASEIYDSLTPELLACFKTDYGRKQGSQFYHLTDDLHTVCKRLRKAPSYMEQCHKEMED